MSVCYLFIKPLSWQLKKSAVQKYISGIINNKAEGGFGQLA